MIRIDDDDFIKVHKLMFSNVIVLLKKIYLFGYAGS